MRFHFAAENRNDENGSWNEQFDACEGAEQEELREEVQAVIGRNEISLQHEEEEEEDDRGRGTNRYGGNVPRREDRRSRIRVKLDSRIGNETDQICRVCGERGHFAGFVGATYVDCKNKPCYLCGGSGHSTQTCPHLQNPGLSCRAAADVGKMSLAKALRQREQDGDCAICNPQPSPGRWNLDAAVLKLHARRVTCLEFHPVMDNVVFSGDKHGQIAVWDVDKVFERTVFPDINRWLTNNIKFLPQDAQNGNIAATSSYDGTIKICDLEVGMALRTVIDVNPAGWAHVEEEDRAGRWESFIGLDVMSAHRGLIVAGTSKGKIYALDHRAPNATTCGLQVHKAGTKVQCINVNPVDSSIVLTAGNDREARLLDLRMWSDSGAERSSAAIPNGAGKGPQIGSWAHPRVINSAYFSPLSGRKIMSTCQDNRIRVWDAWSVDTGVHCDREIVHSHNFSRHLTNFKAEWDPKDASERLAVVGRFISEAIEGLALHPIDLLDVATGRHVGKLIDPNLTTISPVNKFHPRRDLLISGSSRSLYAWKPSQHDPLPTDELGITDPQTSSFADAQVDGSLISALYDVGPGLERPRAWRGTPHDGGTTSKFKFFDADTGKEKKQKKSKSHGSTVLSSSWRQHRINRKEDASSESDS